MLKTLEIENLGLVSSARFDFHKGFTCITGETGSGKTSLIEALKLTLGKKSDFDLIKKGENKAEVTSIFELEANDPIYPLLHKHELSVEPGEALIIKRVLLKEGKSKTLINGQNISVFTLNELKSYLCDFVDQDDLSKLQDDYFYHDLLDKNGGLLKELSDYTHSFEKVKSLSITIDKLKSKIVNKDFKLKILEEEISELEKANILPNEEETSYETYKKFTSIKDSLAVLCKHSEVLNSDLLPKLKRLKSDRALLEFEKELNEVYQKLCDVSMSIESEVSDPSFDEEALVKLEERLKVIYTLKRKYNPINDNFEDLLEKKKQELDELFSLEEEIEKLEHSLNQEKVILKSLADKLLTSRKAFAKEFEVRLLKHLRPLNMPYVELEFRFKECSFNEKGHHMIELFIKANSSSNMVELNDGASGGELARVNFAFFLETSKTHGAECLFFDEIDAHVGGVTSTLMGDHLRTLSESKQVFCVTHFPQMAQKAHNHLSFVKNQDQNQTVVNVFYKQDGLLEFEIDRMSGVKG